MVARKESCSISMTLDKSKKFPNFKFHIALSEPLEEDNWVTKEDVNDTKGDGFIGFVHQCVIDQYLSKHEEQRKSSVFLWTTAYEPSCY